MFHRIGLFAALTVMCFASAWANSFITQSDGSIVYVDCDNTHLTYRLYPSTNQAMIGDGSTNKHNACAYPPQGDKWWSDGQPNLWGDLVIPNTVDFQGVTYTVTSIGCYAFSEATGVYRVTLPETITDIAGAAFYWCVNLEQINIPDGVTSIHNATFELCRKLDDIVLPQSIGSIGENAFMNCSSLTSINIPGKCESIGNDAFSWCLNLSEIVFEDGTKPLTLGYAYEFGPDWQSGSLPYYSANRFWRGLFSDCNIDSVYIGRDIEIPEVPGYGKVTPFEYCVFKGYDELGKQVVLHSGQSINRVSFGSQVTKISENLFAETNIKNEVLLPNSIREIGNNAFKKALNQTNLVIPASCEYIGSDAFVGLNAPSNLKMVECLSNIPPKVGSYPPFSTQDNFFLVVPSGSKSAYKNDSFWKKYTIIGSTDELITVNVKYPGRLALELSHVVSNPSVDVNRLKISGNLDEDDWNTINSMTELYELDLSEMEIENLSQLSQSTLKGLLTIRFPKTLKVIDDSMFSNGLLQGDIVLPATCTTIGPGAFYKTGISSVTITGPTKIMDKAFFSCKNLKNVFIVGDGALLEKECFYFSGVVSLTLGTGTTVCDGAFNSCEKLSELYINGLVNKIEESAFGEKYFNDTHFRKIIFDGGIQNIGHGIFYSSSESLDSLIIDNLSAWCSMLFPDAGTNPMGFAKQTCVNGTSLVNLNIPEDIQLVGDFVFTNCKSLQSVNISHGPISLGRNCFSGCNELQYVSMPQTIRQIGPNAFQSCTSLKSVVLPNNLEIIEDGCFSDCSVLTNVSLPKSLLKIGSSSFKNCKALENPIFPSSLCSIGDSAFYECEAIDTIVFPLGVCDIGPYAFAKCINLKNVVAKWTVPFTIDGSTFKEIYTDCNLNVPYDTEDAYWGAGWLKNIYGIEEKFYSIIISTTSGGQVSYDKQHVCDEIDAVMVDPNDALSVLRFEPVPNYYVKKVLRDGEDITSQIFENSLVLSGIHDNMNFSVEFDDYYIGDVNDDEYIDVADIVEIVNYIQEQPSELFIFMAADVNEDGYVDVGDISGTVNLICDMADYAPSRREIGKCDEIMSSLLYVDESSSNNSHGIVSIGINNEFPMSGFQFEIQLPSGYYIPQNESGGYSVYFSEDRTSEMSVRDVTLLSSGKYQVLCASMSRNQIQGSIGPIVNFRICKDGLGYNSNLVLEIDDIRIADVNAVVTHISPVSYHLGGNDNTRIVAPDTVLSLSTNKHLKDGRIVIVKDDASFYIDGRKIDM